MATCSILIPACNVEKYLRRALDSVLNQTHKDFEIILIDDGSTDSTPQICDEYGEKYSFIHVYHQENIGLSKTRERLLEKANGRYIFWLDSDDYYDPTLLKKVISVFENGNADIVYWNYVKLISDGQKLLETRVNEPEPDKWRELNIWGLDPMVWMYASKKELWDNIEKLPDDVDLTDDVWFTPQVVCKTENIVMLNEALYFYDRTNENSIMSVYTGKRICRGALALYRIIKMNKKHFPNSAPLSLGATRQLLVEAYCVHLVNPSLTDYQIDLIKNALKELNEFYPQDKMKKSYFLQFCVMHEISIICRRYGKSRIRKFKKNNK